MSRPPVVLIHGMWSTPETLADVKEAFESNGYTTHVPRLPYHHPRHELSAIEQARLGGATIQEYLESLCRLIESLDQQPILVGHSMGGLLAQLVAAKYPCNRLILLSSAGAAGYNSWSWSVIRTFGHNLFKFPLWKQTTNLTLSKVSYGIANSQTPAVQKDIITSATYESGMAATQIGMWFLFRRPPTRVNYGNITCPVLVIGGNQDKVTPIFIQKKIVKCFGGLASLYTIDGCCHWTIGGKYFPQITSKIFNWLGEFEVAKSA